MNVNKYTNNLINALINNTYKNGDINSLYQGEEGALRLAREYSIGLKDFDVECQDEIIEESYYTLCNRYYQMNSPITINDWVSEICIHLNKEMNADDRIK